MFGPYVHNIDPIIAKVGGVYLWWYGLGYSLGFLHLHLFLRRHRLRLGLTSRDVYTLTLFIVVGVLVGARLIEIAFDEWPFYSANPILIPAYWLGGLASHGVLLGATVAVTSFALLYRKDLLALFDAVVIPGSFLMGMGRIGNFIDGQIVGALTDVPWGVRFPGTDGIRHPVVLYDGIKNLLLVPFLFRVQKINPTPGATAARFVFWYAFLRVFIDLFRDYPTHRPGSRDRADSEPHHGVDRGRFFDPISHSAPKWAAKWCQRGAGGGTSARRRAIRVTESRTHCFIGVLSDVAQQLDTEHTGTIRQETRRTRTLVALPRHQHLGDRR